MSPWYYEYIQTHMPRQSHHNNAMHTHTELLDIAQTTAKTYFGTWLLATAAAAVAALVDLVMVVMFLDSESSLGFRHTLLLPIWSR